MYASVHLNLETGKFEADALSASTIMGGKVGANLSKSMSSQLKNSVLTGVGLGAGISGFNLLSSAISGTIGLAGDVLKAGADEESSISSLGASLKANIPRWDGNTAAIEKVIASQIRLAFSDEEQRNSLQLLVAATHNVTEAQSLQLVAMDLARFKKISLAAATDALTKVEAGSYRILKSLGIVLKDNATQQDAVNAVEAVAQGQREEFVNTTSGKLLAAQTAWGEKVDEFGMKILPPATVALDDFTKGVNALFDSSPDRQFRLGSPLDWIFPIPAAVPPAVAALDSLGSAVHDAGYEVDNAVGKIAGSVAAIAQPIGNAARIAQMDTRDFLTWTIANLHAKNGELQTIGNDTADAIYGPMERAAGLAANAREQAAQRAIIADHKATAAAKADARDRLLALQKEGLGIRIEMAGRGEFSKAQYRALIADLTKASTHGSAEVRAAAALALHELAMLKAAAAAIPAPPWWRGGRPTPTAEGGPRSAGQLLLVGERGPELWMPQTAGTMLPNSALAAVAGTGSTTYNIPIAITGLVKARDPMEIATQARRFARLGTSYRPPVLG